MLLNVTSAYVPVVHLRLAGRDTWPVGADTLTADVRPDRSCAEDDAAMRLDLPTGHAAAASMSWPPT